MQTRIFYFSGTGNSLKVAREIARNIPDTHLISIPEAMQTGAGFSADRIGLVFPVYMWGLPLMVKEFIKTMKVDSLKYVFAVATYGGMPGATLKQAARLIEEQGGMLSAGFCVKMHGNYTPLYEAIAEEKQKLLFEQAAVKIEKLSGIIASNSEHKIESSNIIVNALFSGILYKLMSPKIHEMDNAFWVNDKCNGCRICEKVCLSGNIEINEDKPVWQGRCEQCLACLQWCPEEAIESGKKTPGRKRYRHPDIKLADMTRKELS
ncbi:MAG: EFR1 family ferrodoxin [Elusimicrobiota bacterium]